MQKLGNPSGSFDWRAPIVLLAAIGIAFWVYWSGLKTTPEEEMRPPQIVKTVRVSPSSQQISVNAHGTVIPSREVTIEPQVSGEIVRHHELLIPGGYIQEGEELFGIDPTLMELSLRESEAAVERAEAQLKEAERNRDESLELATSRVLSKSELAGRHAAVTIRGAELERLRAGLARTRELLRRHSVRAPFNGIVLEESVEIGQRVDRGSATVTLVGADDFWVQASLPVDQLKWVRRPTIDGPGAAVDVYLETGNGVRGHRRGQVVRLLSDMEPTGRLARVLVSIKDPLGNKPPESLPFLLGSFVRVAIDAGVLEDVLAIRRTALRDDDRIWVVDADGKLQIRDVTVMWRDEETVYVRGGLRSGETLIVSSLRVALPGMRVESELVDEPPAGAATVTVSR